MKETFYITINEDDVVRSTGGYHYTPIDEIGLYELVNDCGFKDRELAEEKVEYVEYFEKYAPDGEYHNIATDREKRMAKRSQENFQVKEIIVDGELTAA